MSQPPAAFWVDRDYDRDYASDGISRYGAYLRDATFEPWTDDDQAVEWAAFAWRRATGPVMSPGYVRHHPRILSALLERSSWDGGLAAAVSLVSPWPEEFKTPLARGVRLGGKQAYWQDWPTERLGGTTCFFEPGEADVAARPYLLATVSLHFTVSPAGLPEPLATPAALLTTGQQTVAAVMAELNRIVGPVLSAGLGRQASVTGSAW